MLFYILSFALGLGLIAFCPVVPSLQAVLAILMAGVLLAGIVWRQFPANQRLKILLISICYLLLALTCADYRANQWLSNRLESAWVGKDIVVAGVIAQLPVEEKRYTRFLFKTEQFAGKTQTKRLQLSWQYPHPPLQVGERWQLTVRLKPPHALVNFNGYNRLRLLWAQDIHAAGYVVSKQISHRLAPTSPGYEIARWREQLQQEIKQTVADPTAAAIISALTIGVENGLTDADWQTLQRTGTVHLVVIAGLHIGFMVLIAYFLADKLWRCVPPLLLRIPAQQVGAMAALVFALVYGALAGFSIPTQRAVIMTVLLSIGQLCYREISPWRRIFLAFWFTILLQPGALFSAGLWLSFAAVAWITYGVSGEWRDAPHWRQWLRMQWALFLGLTPLTIYFFQQFSLISMVANLPAIIWIGWVIVPVCLLAAGMSLVSLPVSKWLFTAAGYLLMPLWHFLQWLAGWPFAGWHHAFSNDGLFILALLGAAWCLAPPKIPYRWLGLAGFLPIWLIAPPHPPPQGYWVTMLDVGQGLALTVQTAHHLLVYDTGASIPDGFDAGRDVVSPYLISLGVKQIDLLMVSHGDNDHSGGAKALLSQWPVRRFLTSIPSLFPASNPEYCAAGQQWQWDGVPFQVLWPLPGSAYQDNNSSCVLQIGLPGQRTLLTGDIEGPSEQALVNRYGESLQSAILSVPHHGSKTSSTAVFLRLVHPEYALFSLGYYNRFHFPAPTVTARYRSGGSQRWLTAASGAIRVQVSPGQPMKVTAANPQKYFWEKQPDSV